MRVHSVRHLFKSLFRSVEPPLWAKDVGVRAPDGFGASDAVEALADFGAAGDEEAVDVVAFWGDNLEAEAADGRPHAETFADDCLEVGQGLCLSPGDGGADGGRGAADFVDEGVVGWWGGDEGEEGHAEGVGGGVGAGDAVIEIQC